MSQLNNDLVTLARQAGNAIMKIYQKDFEIYDKLDSSPLTEADLAVHHILVNGLNKLEPRYPVLSEESDENIKSKRYDWNTYWLIDPIDGTKEFIKKNGAFSVNIALIQDGKAILGIESTLVF